jgi:hypothetical protein
VKKQAAPPRPTQRSKFARGPTTFKKTTAARFVRGVMASGLPIAGVECDTLTGKIRVIAGQPAAPNKSELDNWIELHANSTQGAE